MKVSIQFQNIETIMKGLSKLPDKVHKKGKDWASKSARDTLIRLKKNMPASFTGDLRENTQILQSGESEFSIVMPKYGYYVDVGTFPGYRKLPANPLFITWIEQKLPGVPPFAVLRSVQQKGTYWHPFLDQSIYPEFDETLIEQAIEESGITRTKTSRSITWRD